MPPPQRHFGEGTLHLSMVPGRQTGKSKFDFLSFPAKKRVKTPVSYGSFFVKTAMFMHLESYDAGQS